MTGYRPARTRLRGADDRKGGGRPALLPSLSSTTRTLGGGVGGRRGGVTGGCLADGFAVAAGTGRGRGLADPTADTVDQFLAAGGLGMPHTRHEPQVLGLAGRHVQLAGVLG